MLTAVAERLRIQLVTTPPYMGKVTREMVDHELNRFYYDTAQVSNEVTIQALAKLVGGNLRSCSVPISRTARVKSTWPA